MLFLSSRVPNNTKKVLASLILLSGEPPQTLLVCRAYIYTHAQQSILLLKGKIHNLVVQVVYCIVLHTYMCS